MTKRNGTGPGGTERKRVPQRVNRNSWKPGQSGNPAGRPRGAKDKLPRGSVRLAFLDFLQHCDGRKKMRDAIEAAIMDQGKLGLGYMRLGAQVIDRIDHERKLLGQGALVLFNSPINPLTLRMGLPGPEADGDEDPEDE